MRARIIEVMRWSGPRMLTRYPLLSLLHLIDKLRAGSPPVTEAARARPAAAEPPATGPAD
jgi:hypothetical protein